MSARDELIDDYGRADTAPLGTLAELRQKLDAYRDEVIAEYRAAFTMAEARGIARNHRAAVLREAAEASAQWKSDCQSCAVELEVAGELRRLADEAGEEQNAPDFFQPGRTYTYQATGFTAPELIVYFRPEHVTRHPERGHLRAIGWSRTGEPGAKWHGDFYDEFDGWTAVTGGGAREKDTAPSGESTPADLTVYRAEYEHEPFPIGLYANAAAARAHCEHLVRQEWTPSTPLTFEWSVDEDELEVIELDVRVDTDTWSTGYTVRTVVADAEFDPEADS